MKLSPADPDGHETYPRVWTISRPGGTMSDRPTGDDPEAYGDDRIVPCPACESTNSVQIAARGLQYQCRDCSNVFNPSTESLNTDLR